MSVFLIFKYDFILIRNNPIEIIINIIGPIVIKNMVVNVLCLLPPIIEVVV